MRYVLLAIGVVVFAPQAAPLDTEIFLADLSSRGAGLRIGPPVNISRNSGYDNQPVFTPDGGSILFTSVRGGRKPDPRNSAASGSDIYRYDIGSDRITQITDTSESEYSPTITPDGGHISVVRVEADGTQRLWRFDRAGKRPELVLADIKPVGYHAWVDPVTVALFVLGQPPTLQVADTRTGRAEIRATNIGRSLQRMPSGRISFVRRAEGGEHQPLVLTIDEFDAASGETRTLVRAPAGATQLDTAWTPDGVLLVAFEDRLFSWRSGQADLSPAVDLSALGLKGVSRLAVSPAGNRIALVAQTR